MSEMTAEQAPRKEYDLWDKVCAIPSYGFIHSQDNTRVLKVRDIGNWIDRDVVLAIVEQAQYELNELRQAISEVTPGTTIMPDSAFEEALVEIAGMKNLTATPAQFIRHLQLTAANALLTAATKETSHD